MSDNGSSEPTRYPIVCPECSELIAEHVLIDGVVFVEIGSLRIDYIPQLCNPECLSCGFKFPRGIHTPRDVPKFVARWAAKRGRIQLSEGNTAPQ